MMANWVLASHHSRGGIFHSATRTARVAGAGLTRRSRPSQGSSIRASPRATPSNLSRSTWMNGGRPLFESGKRLWLVRPLDSQRLLHRAFSLRRVLRLEELAEQLCRARSRPQLKLLCHAGSRADLNDSRRSFRLLWGRLARRLTWHLKWHFAAFGQVVIGSAGQACAS